MYTSPDRLWVLPHRPNLHIDMLVAHEWYVLQDSILRMRFLLESLLPRVTIEIVDMDHSPEPQYSNFGSEASIILWGGYLATIVNQHDTQLDSCGHRL